MNYQTETLLPCERLDAYHLAVEFHRNIVPLARARGLASLRDQLLRAAESVVLNIAERSEERRVGKECDTGC